jgi:hypothetical protein
LFGSLTDYALTLEALAVCGFSAKFILCQKSQFNYLFSLGVFGSKIRRILLVLERSCLGLFLAHHLRISFLSPLARKTNLTKKNKFNQLDRFKTKRFALNE